MEIANFEGCAANLSRFPIECCSHASSLLLVTFDTIGIDGFLIFKGDRPDGETGNTGHEWIQRDDIVVDITADQFEDLEKPSVIVGSSDWHFHLNGQPQRDALEFDKRLYATAFERIIQTGHFPEIKPNRIGG